MTRWWWVASALAHPTGHTDARHDLRVDIGHQVTVRAEIDVPAGLIAGDPDRVARELAASLQLRIDDGPRAPTRLLSSAPSHIGHRFVVQARVDAPAGPFTVRAEDGAFPGEPNLFRWTLDSERTITPQPAPPRWSPLDADRVAEWTVAAPAWRPRLVWALPLLGGLAWLSLRFARRAPTPATPSTPPAHR